MTLGNSDLNPYPVTDPCVISSLLSSAAASITPFAVECWSKAYRVVLHDVSSPIDTVACHLSLTQAASQHFSQGLRTIRKHMSAVHIDIHTADSGRLVQTGQSSSTAALADWRQGAPRCFIKYSFIICIALGRSRRREDAGDA